MRPMRVVVNTLAYGKLAAVARKDAKGRADWLIAGARQLAKGGVESVRVEPIAKALGVTKGSFYWHFDKRRGWIDAILLAWEERSTLAVIRHVDEAALDARERLLVLWSLNDDPEDVRFELGVRDFATRDEDAATIVERVDTQRLKYLRRNFRALGLSPSDAEARCLLYYSLLIGDYFIAASHGRFSRENVLKRSIDFLLVV